MPAGWNNYGMMANPGFNNNMMNFPQADVYSTNFAPPGGRMQQDLPPGGRMQQDLPVENNILKSKLL